MTFFPVDFIMYFSKATALALTALLQFLSVSAAPLSVNFPRDGGLSASYATLAKPIVSPYYVYFGNQQTLKLPAAFDSLKMTAATVGFASAPQGKCQLDGDLDNLVSDVQSFIAKGGAMSLSFGGNLQDQSQEARQHVQQACTDAPSLTKLIEGAMTQFNTHNIEFDIEDNDLLIDNNAAKRLAQALAQVKTDMPDTFVTYTVGSNPSGMPGQQNTWVQAAKDNGLIIDSLILMTMNMGGQDVVEDAKTAVMGGAKQLANIYGINPPEDAIKKMGMLPSIGVDNNGQIVDTTGITTLGQFAKSQGMSTISYWNFNRDFPGDIGQQQTLDDSSSPDQKDPSQFFTTLLGSVNGAPSSSTTPAISKGAIAGAPLAQAPSASPPSVPPPNDQQPGQKPSLPPPSSDKAPGGGAASS